MRYRNTVSVQSSGYFQSAVGYIRSKQCLNGENNVSEKDNACTLYLHLAGPNYGLDVLNTTMRTEAVIH